MKRIICTISAVLKKTVSVIIAVIMLCGIITPAFAEDETTENPGQKAELVDAYVFILPGKKEVVRKHGKPEYPDGIVLQLEYSDDSAVFVKIEEKDGKFYAGDEEVTYIGKNTDEPLYGKLTAYLEMKGGKIKLSYEFYSPENPKEGVDLIGAQIVYVPLKNLIVFGIGESKEPDGIILRLKYSDGTSELAEIENVDDQYYMAGPFRVFPWEYAVPEARGFGLLIGEIEVEPQFYLFYPFVSLPSLSYAIIMISRVFGNSFSNC
ncbi:MAG: hypothetical protein IJ050_04370 [Clostridia bacterium]|nr:hypothetical protein [Clostridia bacterium]